MTGELLERDRKKEGGEGEAESSKALSFSTKVPRGIRARSVRTYFAIFSRHAISGMTNGGCAPFYPPSITPSHPSTVPARSPSRTLSFSVSAALSRWFESNAAFARENRLPVLGEGTQGEFTRIYGAPDSPNESCARVAMNF